MPGTVSDHQATQTSPLTPPTPAAPPHRGPWRLKEFIFKWKGHWKKLLFSYEKNLIKHLLLLISVHNPGCFLWPICCWSYKTDLSSWSDFPPPCAFVLLKPLSTFVNLSDTRKKRHPINVESCSPWDVPHSSHPDGLVPSQMFPFSR